jgi:2,3-diketo-5-methylthio-1-phosphopentane phosphatase
MNCHVFVDFDGTIMQCDTTDHLLERYALPQWRAVEEDWAAGRIGSRTCMERQVELLRVTPDALLATVEGLEIDPGFPGFLAMLARHGIAATIVSDGLDLVIDTVLRRHRLAVPFYANRLRHAGGDRWTLEFPNFSASCGSAAGHCKCARIEDWAGHLTVVVGDGRSDFCIAGRADLVLAKSGLIEECRAGGLPFLPFRTFEEAERLLNGWLTSDPESAREAARVPLEA